MAESRLNLIIKTTGAEKLRKLKGDADKAEKELSQLQGELDDVDRKSKRASSGVGKLSRALKGLGSVIAGAAIGDQLRRAFGAAAEAEGAAIRARNVVKSYEQLAGIQDVAAASAEKFGISQAQALSDLTDLGSRLGSTGRSLDDIKDIYEGFNTVLVNNAVGAQQAAAAQLQLNQALGSGRLAGEEFNAINEATPQVISAVADVLNVARGEVKGLAADGKVSADVLVAALQKIKTEGADALTDSLAGPAGQLRQFDAAVKDFQVTIGRELLPVITPLVSKLTELLKLFSQLPGPVKALTVGVVALGAAFAVLAPVVGLTVSGLAALLPLIPGLLTIAALAGPWVALAAGLTAVGVAAYNATKSFQQLEDAAKGNLDEVKDLEGATAKYKAELVKAEEQLRKGGRQAVIAKQKIDKLKRALDAIEGEKVIRIRIQEIREKFGIDPNAAPGTRGRQAGIDRRRQEQLSSSLSGGSDSGSGSGSKAKTDDLAALARQEQLLRKLIPLEQNIAAARLAGNTELQIRLEGERDMAKVLSQNAADLARMNTAEGRRLQLAINNQRVLQQQGQTWARLQQNAADQRQAFQDTLVPLQQQKRLLEARLAGRGREVELDIEIERLTKGMTAEQAQQVELLVRGNAEREVELEQVQELEQLYAQVGQAVQDSIVNGIMDAVEGAKDLNEVLTDTLRSLSQTLLRAGLNSVVGGLFPDIPGRAKGGPVSAGQPYVVGEKGPELFVPTRSGTVIPNGGGGVNSVVNVTVTDSGTSTDATQASELGRMIESSVMGVITRERRPGGVLSR